MRKGHCISFRVASIEGASHVFGIGSWQRSNIAGTLSRGKVSSGEEGLTGETISLSYTFRDNCRTSWETLSVDAADDNEQEREPARQKHRKPDDDQSGGSVFAQHSYAPEGPNGILCLPSS